MNFFIRFLLNLFFFTLYSIIALKISEEIPLLYNLLTDVPSVPVSWFRFLIIFSFFCLVSFFSLSTTYAFTSTKKARLKNKKPKTSSENPEVTIDGKEESPAKVMDVLENNSGKVYTEPAKNKDSKSKKKKK